MKNTEQRHTEILVIDDVRKPFVLKTVKTISIERQMVVFHQAYGGIFHVDGGDDIIIEDGAIIGFHTHGDGDVWHQPRIKLDFPAIAARSGLAATTDHQRHFDLPR